MKNLGVIVLIWVSRMNAMKRYLDEKPTKLSENELEVVRSAAIQLILRIDEVLRVVPKEVSDDDESTGVVRVPEHAA